ncbi:hypothetical protein CERZMDRAFT_89646 [Cercospora zeae-maydis SCOH1-5]|uniref:Uncharacterized protein n=1 Tax=Cercospora zeae-maydis SCOH1-5 TaxID=717836 RepID=A0A6A6FX19_9PEZI|nr:hypothetical protein CERZMDRAFT_89646 [Cercospora zeae-maydis SCOH1-5]
MSYSRAHRPTKHTIGPPPTKPRSSKDHLRASSIPSSTSTPSPSRSTFVIPDRPKKPEPSRKQYHYDDNRKPPSPRPREVVSSKAPALRSSRSSSDPTSSPRPRYLEVESGRDSSSRRKQTRSQPKQSEDRDGSQVRFSPFVTIRTYR